MYVKPSWKEDAPTWARYLAQDNSGDWYWYEDRPTQAVGSAVWTRAHAGSRQVKAQAQDDAWSKTLEMRP